MSKIGCLNSSEHSTASLSLFKYAFCVEDVCVEFTQRMKWFIAWKGDDVETAPISCTIVHVHGLKTFEELSLFAYSLRLNDFGCVRSLICSDTSSH